ncbi:MAG TPA: hypothetical protein VIL05_07630 [Thermoclostridium sp.]
MSDSILPDELKLVGENCSQYQQRRYNYSNVMGLYEDEGISCNTCKNWSGFRCIVDAYDNVAVNLGILPEER